MDQSNFDKLVSTDSSVAKVAIKTFVDNNSDKFEFTGLVTTGQWPKIWNTIFQRLRSKEYEDVHPDCLSAIRVMSREKSCLDEAIDIDKFSLLMNMANVGDKNLKCSQKLSIEALKCLCNLVYNSSKCQEMCLKSKIAEGIFERVKIYRTEDFEHSVKFFDMKLLFLVTALNLNVRSLVVEQLNGVIYLIEMLSSLVKETKSNVLTENDANLVCEILKVLFNLTVRGCKSDDESTEESESEEEIQCRRITVVLHDLLLCKSESKEKHNEIVSHSVNLLTNIPLQCFDELISKVLSNDAKLNYENYNMTTISVILDFFRLQLNTAQKAQAQHELISPVLTVLVKCVRCNAVLRRYIRSVILPPLVDVKKRPEEGSTLRNHLCRLLTTPATQVRDLSAELLFIICKENVGRMIKHTGYGNAAGLLANRGLLGGRSNPSCEYSSDSEDSDTEEYKQLQHGINHVLGCYEPPKPNPLEGMTEEQKEYEAMKLINLMSELHRQGIVQPARIGEDGRPRAVEHILELQEEIPQQQMDHKRKS